MTPVAVVEELSPRSTDLSAYGLARSTIQGSPLSPEELKKTDAYWRACKYLALGMIYLQANPLLKEPLKPEHIKNRLLGHWGASPGLAFVYIHLNRLIKKYDLDMIFLAGPGHGAPGPARGRSGGAPRPTAAASDSRTAAPRRAARGNSPPCASRPRQATCASRACWSSAAQTGAPRAVRRSACASTVSRRSTGSRPRGHSADTARGRSCSQAEPPRGRATSARMHMGRDRGRPGAGRRAA